MSLDVSERFQGQVATYQRLLKEGRQARATVKGLRETGSKVGTDPEIELELDVELDGRRYPVVLCQVVSRLVIPELRLGSSLPVRIDPSDPSVLTIA